MELLYIVLGISLGVNAMLLMNKRVKPKRVELTKKQKDERERQLNHVQKMMN